MDKLTHFDEQGNSRMVEVGEKKETVREAIAKGRVVMQFQTLQLIKDGQMSKGDVLGVARIAGIMAAKKTSSFIPLCHPLLLTGIDIHFAYTEKAVEIEARVRTTGKTGVEMEALTAVSVTALTIYDMCKAVDKGMILDGICLIKKTGGKSGTFYREEDVNER